MSEAILRILGNVLGIIFWGLVIAAWRSYHPSPDPTTREKPGERGARFGRKVGLWVNRWIHR